MPSSKIDRRQIIAQYSKIYISLLDVLVSHQTISTGIEKYVRLMQLNVDKLKPNVYYSWRAILPTKNLSK